MKTIEFTEVGMKNFGPFIEPMILKFEKNTLNLITGPNGVGKTMSLDAIPFTFFGITSKGLKGDDVVNNVAGKNCNTWVSFKIDNDNYIAKRYQKYSKFGGNNLILNKNGVDIKSGAREVQPEIEKLICPQKGFMNTLMFGQKVGDFFTDLTDSKQKEIFRKLLGLDNYVDYYKEADNRRKKLNDSIQETLQKINIKKELLKESAARIAELKEAKKQFEKTKQDQLKNIKKSLENIERIINSNEEEIKKLKLLDHDTSPYEIKIHDLNIETSNIYNLINQKESEIHSHKKNKILEVKNSAQEKMNQISSEFEGQKDKIIEEWRKNEKEIDKKIQEVKDNENEIKNKIESLRLESKYIQDNINKINNSVFESEISTCPICHQNITDHTKEDLKNEITESNKRQHEIACEIEKLEVKFIDYNKLKSKLELEKKEIDREASQTLTEKEKYKTQQQTEINSRLDKVLKLIDEAATNQIKTMKDDLEKTRQEKIDIIHEVNIKYKEVLKRKEDLNHYEELLKSSINSKENTINNYKQKELEEYDETQINGYKARVISYTNEMKELSESSEGIERLLKVTEFWKNAYSPVGIPSMLTDEAIPFMNKKVAEYLDEISNGRYIVSFDTQDTIKSGEIRDKISVNVLDTYTRANKRLQLSGGQTRLVDIATILTLGDLQANNLGIKVNILIFDEIFDSLDAQNIDYVSKVLTRLKKNRSIYLISHFHQDQLEPDNILEILR